ncbi:hypothetical protein [Fibrobacter sp. UWB11]|uniref:hypothetical protein n=1 Tax=Fibrobacter sp. UWB11 TaxID=1896202 RepID=UPI0011152D16|nr:hypothetical protein [Fibrobacter sp. UWB11]
MPLITEMIAARSSMGFSTWIPMLRSDSFKRPSDRRNFVPRTFLATSRASFAFSLLLEDAKPPSLPMALMSWESAIHQSFLNSFHQRRKSGQ